MRSVASLARRTSAPTRPSIAHVITESNPFGGAQRNTLLTVEGLARDGYPVELVCGPGGALIARAEASGVPVHVMPDLTRKTDPRRDLKTAIALYRLFRARRYRVVHTHSTKAGLLGRLASSAARVPVVVHTFHGFPFVLDGSLRSRIFISLERCVGRLTDASVCVADALRSEVSRWGIPGQRKLLTIYSGIDFAAQLRRRSATEVKRELGVDSAGPIVGSIGHLREAKAQHELVEAIGMLRADHPDIRLVIAGEGEQRGFLERRIRDLGLSDRVLLLGERDDIPDLLGAFDVYAMSSHWEGVGRALTEAMYWGLPVVVTGVYGVKEIVLHEDTGLLVPPRDPRALAAAIGRVLRDPALARRLGTRAKQRVKEQMDGARMIRALECLYAELGA